MSEPDLLALRARVDSARLAGMGRIAVVEVTVVFEAVARQGQGYALVADLALVRRRCRDDDIFGIAGNAIGKDGHQRRTEREIVD